MPKLNHTFYVTYVSHPLQAVNFQWSGNAGQYEFFMKKPGKNYQGFGKSSATSFSLNANIYDVDQFQNSTTWKVRAYDSKGNYVDSPEYQYKLSYNAVGATLLSPTPNQVLSGNFSTVINFAWSNANAFRYRLHLVSDVGTYPENTQLFDINGWNQGYPPSTTYQLTKSQVNCLSCTWWVESLGPNGETKDSEHRSFANGSQS